MQSSDGNTSNYQGPGSPERSQDGIGCLRWFGRLRQPRPRVRHAEAEAGEAEAGGTEAGETEAGGTEAGETRVNRLLELMEQEEKITASLEERQQQWDKHLNQIGQALAAEEKYYGKDQKDFAENLNKMDNKLRSAEDELNTINADITVVERNTMRITVDVDRFRDEKTAYNIPVV